MNVSNDLSFTFVLFGWVPVSDKTLTVPSFLGKFSVGVRKEEAHQLSGGGALSDAWLVSPASLHRCTKGVPKAASHFICGQKLKKGRWKATGR